MVDKQQEKWRAELRALSAELARMAEDIDDPKKRPGIGKRMKVVSERIVVVIDELNRLAGR